MAAAIMALARWWHGASAVATTMTFSGGGCDHGGGAVAITGDCDDVSARSVHLRQLRVRDCRAIVV